ncbi:MAG: nitroreductase family protein [Myxococcota bacterium]|nr:nitroreductase family protein [Myxococcota bacterium]
MSLLDLSPDEVLTTTRAVRKRLDYDRKVERKTIEDCLRIALQAPNGGNMNSWRWIVIDDPALIARVADLYRGGMDDYISTFDEAGYPGAGVEGADRIETSTMHLRENFHRLPALLLPLIPGRTDGDGGPGHVFYQASQWGSVIQAVWSFMLALRTRGLGSAWTTAHLWRERELAELLGVPHEIYMQVGLFPIAYTLGTDFKPAHREPIEQVVGWNGFAPGGAEGS